MIDSMTIVDVGIVLFLLLSVAIGVYRGFTRELFSLIAWVTPIVLAVIFWGEVDQFLANSSHTQGLPYMDNSAVRLWLSVAIIFLPSFLLLMFIKALMESGIDEKRSGGDRFLGFIYGAVRAEVILIVAVVFGQYLALSETNWWQKSLMIAPAEAVANKARSYLPEGLLASHVAEQQEDDAISFEELENSEEQEAPEEDINEEIS